VKLTTHLHLVPRSKNDGVDDYEKDEEVVVAYF
jgi:hypothetical protein